MTTRVAFVASSEGVTSRPSYSAAEYQSPTRLFFESGVVASSNPTEGDPMKVIPSSPINNTVEVKRGEALVEITRNSAKFKPVFAVTSQELLVVSPNDSGLPRIDKVIARIDVVTEPDSAAANIGILEIVDGTPATTPTAPPTPANAIELATIYVAAGATTFDADDITDTRSFSFVKNDSLSIDGSEVGLGNVQNYGIASQAEAEAGTVDNKYMTPLKTAQAIQAIGATDYIEKVLNEAVNGTTTPKAVSLAYVYGSTTNYLNYTSPSASYTEIYESRILSQTFISPPTRSSLRNVKFKVFLKGTQSSGDQIQCRLRDADKDDHTPIGAELANVNKTIGDVSGGIITFDGWNYVLEPNKLYSVTFENPSGNLINNVGVYYYTSNIYAAGKGKYLDITWQEEGPGWDYGFAIDAGIGANTERAAGATSIIEERTKFLGFVKDNKTTGQSVKIYKNIVDGFTGLEIGKTYYIAETSSSHGLITTTPPTVAVPVGIAVSATEIKTVFDNPPIQTQEYFGDYESFTADTLYQAETDGFINVLLLASGGVNAEFNGRAGSYSAVTGSSTLAIRGRSKVYQDNGAANFPVKKGEYYKVSTAGDGSYQVYCKFFPLIK